MGGGLVLIIIKHEKWKGGRKEELNSHTHLYV